MTALRSTDEPRTDQLSAPELAAWRGLLEVHASVTQRLDSELRAAHGLPVSAYEVLMILVDAPGRQLRMSEIARRALLSRSGCTRLVDRLVRQGYVRRAAAAEDGRGLLAELTEAGVVKVHAARRTHLDGIRRLFLDRLTATDAVALGDIWSRVLPG